jgi:hypothetical protein
MKDCPNYLKGVVQDTTAAVGLEGRTGNEIVIDARPQQGSSFAPGLSSPHLEKGTCRALDQIVKEPADEVPMLQGPEVSVSCAHR